MLNEDLGVVVTQQVLIGQRRYVHVVGVGVNQYRLLGEHQGRDVPGVGLDQLRWIAHAPSAMELGKDGLLHELVGFRVTRQVLHEKLHGIGIEVIGKLSF